MKHVVICLGMLLIIGAGFDAFSQSTTPNYVKTEYFVDPDSVSSTSISYSDGLGRQIQANLDLGNSKVRVSGTVYDNLGRPLKATVPFISSTTDYIPDPITAAQTERVDLYPYSESLYKTDPLGRNNMDGAPGADLSLAGTHFSQKWYFGTKITGADQTNIDKYGLIYEGHTPDLLTNSALNALEMSGAISDPTQFLLVSKGPNDSSYSQEITDVFGRIVSTSQMLGIRAEYTYDILDNVLKESPPHIDGTIDPRSIDDSKATYYQYNTNSKLIKKLTPDAGLVEYLYGPANLLIATQNAKQSLTPGDCDYTVYLYDEFQRNFATGINKTSISFHSINPYTMTWTIDDVNPSNNQIDLRIRKIFDDPENCVKVLGATFTPAYFASNFTPIANTKGKLILEIAYLSNPAIVNPTALKFFENITVDMYSYDEEGQVVTKLKRIPRLKNFCMFTFSYNQLSHPLAYHYAKNDAGEDPTMDNITYEVDRHGRMNFLKSRDYLNITRPIMKNEFNDYGLLSRKEMGTDIGTSAAAYFSDHNYNIRSWPVSVVAGSGFVNGNYFSETGICYNSPGYGIGTLNHPKYNGNISAIRYDYNVSGSDSYGILQYEHDVINRLIDVSTTDMSYSANEQFSYFRNGMIEEKKRNSGPSGVQMFQGKYKYYANTNRLNYVSGYPGKDNTNNFIYDPNGNMILDYSKKMYIEYDWRDKPVTFKFFKSVPPSVMTGDALTMWNAIKIFVAANAADVVSEVKMAYDAGGKRVLKKEYKYQ